MTIKISKFADIVGKQVMLSAPRKAGDAAAIITNFTPVRDPEPGSSWQMDLEIGEGAAARHVKIDLPPLLSVSDAKDVPAFLQNTAGRVLVYFRDRLFLPERAPMTVTERDEVTLRIKKAVYDEEAELSSLRAAVGNLEAAIEFEKSGPKRDPIPEDVKLVVWARDGGSCVRCGSRENLHFDHIIPVAKGGSNSELNIQILCQTCNLKKSDQIAVT